MCLPTFGELIVHDFWVRSSPSFHLFNAKVFESLRLVSSDRICTDDALWSDLLLLLFYLSHCEASSFIQAWSLLLWLSCSVCSFEQCNHLIYSEVLCVFVCEFIEVSIVSLTLDRVNEVRFLVSSYLCL